MGKLRQGRRGRNSSWRSNYPHKRVLPVDKMPVRHSIILFVISTQQLMTGKINGKNSGMTYLSGTKVHQSKLFSPHGWGGGVDIKKWSEAKVDLLRFEVLKTFSILKSNNPWAQKRMWLIQKSKQTNTPTTSFCLRAHIFHVPYSKQKISHCRHTKFLPIGRRAGRQAGQVSHPFNKKASQTYKRKKVVKIRSRQTVG